MSVLWEHDGITVRTVAERVFLELRHAYPTSETSGSGWARQSFTRCH